MADATLTAPVNTSRLFKMDPPSRASVALLLIILYDELVMYYDTQKLPTGFMAKTRGGLVRGMTVFKANQSARHI